jgi:hypothetical protein
MKRILWSMAFFGLCLIAPVCLVRAQTPLQIAPDQAVGVLSEDPSSGERWSTSIFPFGNYVGLDSGEDVFCRTYLRFPLDTIPVSAIVQSATLHVYVDDYWPAPGSAPMSVYPAVVAWTPDSVDWYDIGDWPALGAAVATTVVSSTMGWYGWDVTSLVQGWVDGAPNHGLAVAAADLGSTASNWAAARRLTAGDPATRPYLEVIFSEPTSTPFPPPPTATATRKPSRPTTPQPAAPTATPIPTVTPTPELVLLPITGGGLLAAGAWTLLVGGGLGLLAGLAGAVSRNFRL